MKLYRYDMLSLFNKRRYIDTIWGFMLKRFNKPDVFVKGFNNRQVISIKSWGPKKCLGGKKAALKVGGIIGYLK